MCKFNFSFLISIFLILQSEVGFAQPSKYADDADIASLRPRFKQNDVVEEAKVNVTSEPKIFVKPQFDVTENLNSLLDSVYVRNLKFKFAQGYRVQVFSGTDRAAMNLAKQKIYKLLPEVELYTIFKQPEYRISFGDFIDKTHAYSYLVKINKVIPEALIIQDQINIRTKRK